MLSSIKLLARYRSGRLGFLTAVAIAPIAIITVIAVGEPGATKFEEFFAFLMFYTVICGAIAMPSGLAGVAFGLLQHRRMTKALIGYSLALSTVGFAAFGLMILLAILSA